MKTIPLYFDEPTFRNVQNEISLTRDAFQKLLDEVLKLELEPIKVKSFKDLLAIAETGETEIKSRIAEQLEPQKIGLFRMKKSAMVEALELPSFASLNTIARECREKSLSYSHYLGVSGKEVTILEEEVEKLRTMYSVIPTTAAQNNLAKVHQAAATALQALSESLQEVYGPGYQVRMEDSVRKLFRIDEDGISISREFYRTNRFSK